MTTATTETQIDERERVLSGVRHHLAVAREQGQQPPGRPTLARVLGATDHQVRQALRAIAAEEDTAREGRPYVRLLPARAPEAADERLSPFETVASGPTPLGGWFASAGASGTSAVGLVPDDAAELVDEPDAGGPAEAAGASAGDDSPVRRQPGGGGPTRPRQLWRRPPRWAVLTAVVALCAVTVLEGPLAGLAAAGGGLVVLAVARFASWPQRYTSRRQRTESRPSPSAAATPRVAAPQPAAGVAGRADHQPRTDNQGPRHRPWALLVIGLACSIGLWGGWVELGAMTGFGQFTPLPGLVDDFQLNSAWTLPISLEAYAAYAFKHWLDRRSSQRTMRFARISAITSLVIGAAAQSAYHLMKAENMTVAPWQITMLVAWVPVAVVGLAAPLAHMVIEDRRAAASDRQPAASAGGIGHQPVTSPGRSLASAVTSRRFAAVSETP